MATSAQRLALLYEVSRRLATFNDLDELTRFATRPLRELFAAEGCAVLLLDAARREFTIPIASQSEAQAATQEHLEVIRFPADQGIAGWVLDRGEATIVADTQTDERFFSGVDAETGLTTRSLLCAPLRTQAGCIGVIEVINPETPPSDDDLRFLEALADDIGAAYERARLYDQLRGEAVSLRQVCTVTGACAIGVGLLFAVGIFVTAAARAVPLVETVLAPRLLGSLLGVVLGAVLVAAGRGGLTPAENVKGERTRA